MSSIANFSLKYDGPALTSNEMDVKDLAPALLAVGEVLEESNRLINGDRVAITVNIRATDKGSVVVELAALQTILQQAAGLFNSDGVNAVLNVKEILALLGIGGGGGLIALIKWMKGRELKNVTTVDVGNFRLELSDGEAKVVSKTEIELFSALRIRKSLETIIHNPLQKNGIDSVSFKEGRQETVVEKDEGEYFEAPQITEEPIGEVEIEQSLQIVNISFQEGGKWRFSDGNALFYADILDKDFIDKVSKNQASFAKDDVLRVVLRKKQSLISTGLKTDYTVLRVVEHKSAAITIKLPFDNDRSEVVR